MIDILEEQNRNIDQLCPIDQNGITDAYKAKSYSDQVTAILKKIDNLLAIYDGFSSKRESLTPLKLKQLFHDLAVELNLLKATSQAMEEQRSKSEDIQCSISGNLMDLRKKIDRTIERVTQALESQ